MNDALIESLLHEPESASLDFKSRQYKFEGANDDEKSELLKDILAFSNAWSRADAYILIGVEEVRGGRGRIIGTTIHLEDHALQQFVNDKVQSPIALSYRVKKVDSKELGVIHIPKQSRPFFAKRNYGKVKKETVYVRRGSSTGIAKPDEIAKMGKEQDVAEKDLRVDIDFLDHASRVGQGKEINLVSSPLDIWLEGNIPDYRPDRGKPALAASYILSRPNKHYYRELVSFFNARMLFSPIAFYLINQSKELLRNLRLLIEIPTRNGIRIIHRNDFPERPLKSDGYVAAITNPRSLFDKSDVKINKLDTKYSIEIHVGDIQPKAEGVTSDSLRIGSLEQTDLEFKANLFADNLPDPVANDFAINFECESSNLTLEELEAQMSEIDEAEIRELLDD